MRVQVEMQFQYARDRYPCHVCLTLRLPFEDADLWFSPNDAVFNRPLSINYKADRGETWQAQVWLGAKTWEEAVAKAEEECEEAIKTLRRVVERNRNLIASVPQARVIEYDL